MRRNTARICVDNSTMRNKSSLGRGHALYSENKRYTVYFLEDMGTPFLAVEYSQVKGETNGRKNTRIKFSSYLC